MSSFTTSFPIENRLLAALPRDEYESLLPKLELVRFPRNRILYEAGDALHYAYFPNSGMASLLAITEDGSTIEIGTVGREGYLGAPILHQVGITPYRVTSQIPLTALRIEAKGVSLRSESRMPVARTAAALRSRSGNAVGAGGGLQSHIKGSRGLDSSPTV